MKFRTSKKREVEEKKLSQEEVATISHCREHRRLMKERCVGFIEKSARDEIREIELYLPYESGFEYSNPWRANDMHGTSNDVALITAELDD
jgi:hypothetical protein